jgi:H+/Cl- antiporter ClcA
VQVYAVVVGSMAAISALLYALTGIFLQYRNVALLFAWDWIMVILWAALSGVFGSMYINEKVEMQSGIHRMKVAVGFDLAGMVLWFLTAALGLWWFLTERRSGGKMSRGKA